MDMKLLKDKSKAKQLVFLTALFVILVFNFITNVGNIYYAEYRMFDRPDEVNIVARLSKSKHEGILSYGGMTGCMYDLPMSADSIELFKQDINYIGSYHYKYFLEDKEIPGGWFRPYMSQSGGQGMMYSVIQSVSPLNNAQNLQLFKLINILLVALVLVIFVGWVYRNYGFLVALVVSLFIVTTPIFGSLAFNLWWALWSFFIPILTMLLVMEQRNKNPQKYSDGKVFIYLAIAVFAKTFFTGCEFVSTAMIATMCPVIYYLILERRKLKYSIIFLFKASMVAVAATFAEMFILVLQIRAYKGTFADGIDHLMNAYFRRSEFGDPNILPKSKLDVLYQYFFELNHAVWGPNSEIQISFALLFALFILLAVVVYFFTKKETQTIQYRNRALLLTTLISVAAPLSWLIIFTSHSDFHIFIDPLVWYLPFILLGYVIVGEGIRLIISKVKKE